MALKNQIQTELTEAMKAGESLKVSVLRMLKAAILKFEVAGERKEATDEDILEIVNKEIKQRRDSAEQFRAGNRFEQAEKEEKEIEVLMTYMPPQLTEEEIITIAKEVIEEVGAKSKADTGRVMGIMMGRVKGQADGKVVGDIVGSLLV
jgi:uncharacterized protein YqeY